MTCSDGESICFKDVNLINNDIFLERDTSFTVTLTDVQYIGSDGMMFSFKEKQKNLYQNHTDKMYSRYFNGHTFGFYFSKLLL